jgi:hypothetical protein
MINIARTVRVAGLVKPWNPSFGVSIPVAIKATVTRMATVSIVSHSAINRINARPMMASARPVSGVIASEFAWAIKR